MTPAAVLYRSLLEHASLPVCFVRQAHGGIAGDVHLARLLTRLAVEFVRPTLSQRPAVPRRLRLLVSWRSGIVVSGIAVWRVRCPGLRLHTVAVFAVGRGGVA